MVRTATAPLLGVWAAAALRQEAVLAPKPGLVDGRGPGAHRDMDLALLLRSADILEPWFERLVAVSRGRPIDAGLRTELGEIGRQAEADMLAGTGGVNTHRGALYALGLLVAGAAAAGTCDPAKVAAAASALARLPDAGVRGEPDSHGRRARRLVPNAGAARQAQAGFPAVVDVALPALRGRRANGAPEEVARLDALLALMAVVDDTCVLSRGGVGGLGLVKAGAAHVLVCGGAGTPVGHTELLVLDRRLISHGLSPGGSGDLLAATLLLDRLCRS
jgi:triphosphoribosyl-dephospho-CoA synthase